jgi:FHS family L-fucose permease-like MFS transporter
LAVTVGLPMLIAFMVGRWVGTLLMQKIPAWKVLASFSFLAILPLIYIIAVGGPHGRTCLIVSEFFMSICFPTIFALSIKDLGNRTEMASSALIMSIVGGAILPPMMGAMADSLSATPDKMYQTIYIIPALCFAGVTVFSLCYRKLKPDEAA